MKVLLDTNIIIYREASRIVRQQIGTLFYWIDHLNYQKCIHPLSLDEIRKHKDPKVVEAFEAKTKSYYILKLKFCRFARASQVRYDRRDSRSIAGGCDASDR